MVVARGIHHGERIRLAVLFGALGAVPVFLVGWFGWLQILQGGELRRGAAAGSSLPLSMATADRQRTRRVDLPGPRGVIADRHGATLAIDCEAYEVRAEVRPPRESRQHLAALRAYLDEVSHELGAALARDPGLADRRRLLDDATRAVRGRLERAFGLRDLPATGPLPEPPMRTVPRRAEVLVATDVAVLSVLEALRAVDETRSSVHLFLQHRHVRHYPAREVTYGLVGYVEDLPIYDDGGPDDGVLLGYERFARVGLEAMNVLQPGAPGQREYRVDSRGRPFFVGAGQPAAASTRAVSTLDLELQKVASRLLVDRALMATDDKAASGPQWGALVLVEIATGDVLAAASWHRDAEHAKGAAFAPNQLTYEPGSIVKPLVFAYALQYGGLDWNREFDCSSTGRDHSTRVEEAHGRVVRDDHACGVFTPHRILVESSNIGAVKVGSRLDRSQWLRYLDDFGFTRAVGLPLPNERWGRPNAKGLRPEVTAANFRKWTAASYSFGYEHQVTALQVARAYATLLNGRRTELRLLLRLDIDGRVLPVPVGQDAGRPLFDPAVVEAIRAAMIDVVSEKHERATGHRLVDLFRDEEQIELHGLVGGKTGTAVSRSVVEGRTVEVRNASFVGFAPADAPRYLAVCVLQKDDSARFYGGSYAAPPATRLLLEAMHLEHRRRLRREPQVRAVPGGSGRSGQAPETSQAGR